jgi:hypothetical protein
MLTNSNKLINLTTLAGSNANSISETIKSDITYKTENNRLSFLGVLIQNFIDQGECFQVPFDDRYYSDKRVDLKIPKRINGSVVKDVIKALAAKGYVKIERGNTGKNRTYTIVTALDKLMNLINSGLTTQNSPTDAGIAKNDEN